MVENDIKPCYVFDGKPPKLKDNVLKKRFSHREEAKTQEEEAKETGQRQCLCSIFLKLILRRDEFRHCRRR